MKFILKNILMVFFGLIVSHLNAQTNDTIIVEQAIEKLQTVNDSIELIKTDVNDSLIADSSVFRFDELALKEHLPRKATIFSAVLPGLGQIYNKQSWKVPVIYGGFVGLGYLIKYNQKKYLDYKRSYYELIDNNPSTQYYNDVLRDPVDEFTVSSSVKSGILQYVEGYSRRRNLMIISAVGFYLFNILDANVNAHLIDFDISEDLSFNFEPIASDPITSIPIMGATLTYNFK